MVLDDHIQAQVFGIPILVGDHQGLVRAAYRCWDGRGESLAMNGQVVQHLRAQVFLPWTIVDGLGIDRDLCRRCWNLIPVRNRTLQDRLPGNMLEGIQKYADSRFWIIDVAGKKSGCPRKRERDKTATLVVK